MQTIGLFEAKTHLSRFVKLLVEGTEQEVVISRHGKSLVRMTPIRVPDTTKRIGLARGRFDVPEDIDGANAAVASLFAGKEGKHATAP